MYLRRPVYLDNAATTRVDPEVLAAMLPFHTLLFGNPSSRHLLGGQARRAVESARAEVASGLGCEPQELVFTSGGTEANNLAVLGSVLGAGRCRPHVVVSAVEHPSVLRAAEALERRGVGVTRVGVDSECRVDPGAVMAAVRPETVLVSVMLVNHEVGAIQPVAEMARRLQGRRTWLHADAVQALGKLPVNVRALGVDLLSLSAHKIHGPKGAGALFVRRGVCLRPRLVGGEQERGLRAGTQNVPAIVGFGCAVQLAQRRLHETMRGVAALRDELERQVLAALPNAAVNGGQGVRACHISNITFHGMDSDSMLDRLSALGICASPGSACGCIRPEPSPVLRAMGRSPAAARSSIRFSFSRENTVEDLACVLQALKDQHRGQGLCAGVAAASPGRVHDHQARPPGGGILPLLGLRQGAGRAVARFPGVGRNSVGQLE